MYQDNKEGVSIKVILDKRHMCKNGLYPIKIRIFHRRISKYYRTWKYVSLEEWERLTKTRDPRLLKIRNSVKNNYELILENIEELSMKGDFSFDLLDVRLGRVKGRSINATFEEKIERLYNDGQIGTMKYYKCVLNSIEKFAGKNISLNSINEQWLISYEKHSLNTRNINTIAMHMRAIRTILKQSINSGELKAAHYPFGKGKYEIRTGDSIKKTLSMGQISKIAHYPCTGDVEYFRDLWLFSYMCNGINMMDLVKLKYRNIVDDEICFN